MQWSSARSPRVSGGMRTSVSRTTGERVRAERSERRTEWLGDASVSESGTMNLPAEARRHLGIRGATTVLVFAQPGRVILTPIGLADELLEFAAAQVEARKTASSADTSG